MDRGKYEALLDPDMLGLHRSDQRLVSRPKSLDLPIARQRAIYDAMCRAFHRATRPASRRPTARSPAAAMRSRSGAIGCKARRRRRRSSTIMAAASSSAVSTAMTTSAPSCAPAPAFDVVSRRLPAGARASAPGRFRRCADARSNGRRRPSACRSCCAARARAAISPRRSRMRHAATASRPIGQVLIYPEPRRRHERCAPMSSTPTRRC